MIFEPLPLTGAYVISIEPSRDDRGFFARTFCAEEFGKAGLKTTFVQNSTSFNTRRGTLRGMHFQAPPHEEAKIVRCVSGAAYDVIIDLRAGSPTQRRWSATELTAENNRMVYVPEGFAHGFVTLADATTVEYQISTAYAPQAARGVRWNDPAFAIDWPLAADLVISERDASFPLVEA